MDHMRWEPLNPPASPPAPPVPASPASFCGDRGDFFRLVARGAALELVTAGFYRFWLATDIRRHLWSNITVDGDAPEYTGRGKELLIGFLFALAILVPVYLAYFIAGLEAERFKAFGSFPLFVFFYLFGQFAVYRARRYRLTRTVWRSVRFWMDGSGWAYAARAVLWALLTLLTLGLALPWREAALERYKMCHSHYGDLQGSFDGRGWEFFKRGWKLWLVTALPFIATILAPTIRKAAGLPLGALRVIGLLTLVWMIALPFIYGAFKAIEWRWWVSGIRFGEVRFESKLPHDALLGLYWTVIGWFVLAAAVFAIYLKLSVSLIGRGTIAQLFIAGHLKDNVPMLVLIGLGYLAFILALNVVKRVYLMRDLWARIADSTLVHDIAGAANVTAMGDMADAVGEGLADGLDLVVGF